MWTRRFDNLLISFVFFGVQSLSTYMLHERPTCLQGTALYVVAAASGWQPTLIVAVSGCQHPPMLAANGWQPTLMGEDSSVSMTGCVDVAPHCFGRPGVVNSNHWAGKSLHADGLLSRGLRNTPGCKDVDFRYSAWSTCCVL